MIIISNEGDRQSASMRVARTLFAIAAALAVATDALAQAAKPDLTGRWKLDPEATATTGGGRGDASGNASGGGGREGGGIGLGPPADELTIQQNDTMLIVEPRRGDTDISVVRYRLDGKMTRNLMPIGRGRTAEASYASRWNGPRLETSITRTISSRGNLTDMRYRELLYLAPDGALVLETTVSGRPAGRKAVYRKVN